METGLILINAEWLAPFNGRSAAEQLEVRLAIETYFLTGDVPEFESDAVALAFPYIKREIDAIKVGKIGKSEKRRIAGKKGAEVTNRKKAEMRRQKSATSAKTAMPNLPLNPLGSRELQPEISESEKSAKSAKSAIDIDIDIDKERENIKREINFSTLSPSRAREPELSFKEIVDDFIANNQIAFEGCLATEKIDESKFRTQAEKVLVKWVAAGWQPARIQSGRDQYQALDFLRWITTQNKYDSKHETPATNKLSRRRSIEPSAVSAQDYAEPL